MAVRKDGKYAWLVLASSMVINFLCIGFCFGVIGILTYEYEVEFDTNLKQTSLIGSILIAVVFSGGPLAAFFISKLGVRTVAISAAVVHLAGFAASAFVKTWWQVIPTFAVLCGLASCCAHVCIMKILTVYFDRYQHMAYAASALGSDAAAISLPFITTGIFSKLSYRHSILALAAMLTLNIPCAIILKGAPAPRRKGKKSCECLWGSAEDENDEENETDRKLSEFQLDAEAVQLKETSSTSDEHKDEMEADSNGNRQSVASDKLINAEDGTESKPEEAAEKIYTMWDHFELLTTPKILVFIVNNLLWNMGGAVVSIVTYTYCKDKDFSDKSAGLVMTMYGVGSFCGSLFVTVSSFVCNFYVKKLNRYYLHSVCNVVMGATSILIPYVVFNEFAVTICIFIIGAGYGTVCSNMGSVIEHLNGSHSLYIVYSYQMFAAGIASFIGPIAGAQIDAAFGSGSAFYFAGATKLAAFILFVVFALIDRSVITPYSESANLVLPNNDSSENNSADNGLPQQSQCAL